MIVLAVHWLIAGSRKNVHAISLTLGSLWCAVSALQKCSKVDTALVFQYTGFVADVCADACILLPSCYMEV